MIHDMEKNPAPELRTLTGARYQAVRIAGSPQWLVTRGFLDGRLPLAVHLQLLEGVDRGDPGAVVALHGREVALPRLMPWQLGAALLILFACLLILGRVVSSGGEAPGDSARLLMGGAIVAWGYLLFMEALAIRTELGGNEPVFRITLLGPRVEPVAWLLLESKWVAWVSLLMPLACAGLGVSGYFPQWFGLGLAGVSLLMLAVRSCPFIHGPVSALLGRARGISDYPRFLRMSLASWWVPSGKNLLERTRTTLASGAAMAIAWAVACIGGFTIFRFHARPVHLVDLVWTRFWDGLFGLFLIWGVSVAVHLFQDAMRMRTRGRVSLTIPDQAMVRRWKEGCAMLYHVPGLIGAHWEWFRVEPGCPLVRFGQMEAAFWWVATGSLEKVGRNHKGAEIPEGMVRAGSAFATGLLQEKLVSPVEWIAMEPTVLCKLSSAHLDQLSEETRRKANSFIQISNAFDRCPVLTGMHPVLKEIWLSKGRLIWVPGGTVLMEDGEEATWMGLLVQGLLRKDHQEEEVFPDSLIGDEILSYKNRRGSTLITGEVSLIMRWEYPWLRQWIPATPEGDSESEFSQPFRPSVAG